MLDNCATSAKHINTTFIIVTFHQGNLAEAQAQIKIQRQRVHRNATKLLYSVCRLFNVVDQPYRDAYHCHRVGKPDESFSNKQFPCAHHMINWISIFHYNLCKTFMISSCFSGFLMTLFFYRVQMKYCEKKIPCHTLQC